MKVYIVCDDEGQPDTVFSSKKKAILYIIKSGFKKVRGYDGQYFKNDVDFQGDSFTLYAYCRTMEVH